MATQLTSTGLVQPPSQVQPPRALAAPQAVPTTFLRPSLRGAWSQSRLHGLQPATQQTADRHSFAVRAIPLQADVPLGEDGYGNDLEVSRPAQDAPHQDFVDRLKQAVQRAAEAGQRLTSLAIRLATLVASSMVLSVAARIQQQHKLRELAAKQQQRAQEALAAAAQARIAAQEKLQAALAKRSKADRAFVRMLFSQDNPARGLDEKWRDMCRHMRSQNAPEFRQKTARLFSAALDSSHAVQMALKTEASNGRRALDRLVQQHDCVKEETELRSLLFAQMLNGHAS